MSRYKYSENPNEATIVYVDSETKGELMGIEQEGEMKSVTLPILREGILAEADIRLDALEKITTQGIYWQSSVEDIIEPIKNESNHPNPNSK